MKKCKICGLKISKKKSLSVLSKQELKRFKALKNSLMCVSCKNEIGFTGIILNLIQ